MRISGTSDALCFSDQGIISWCRFAADVAELRIRISAASHICNLLTDRYEFMVGLAAAILNEQDTILPAAAAPQAIRAALADAPHPLILGGEPKHHGPFDSLVGLPKGDPATAEDDIFSELNTSTTQIHVFTSGSTKLPERRVKDWPTLVGGAAVTEEILRKLDVEPGTTAILGTTPHQHMYGLEATVFLSLGFGHCAYRKPIFYPADIEIAVADARACGFEQAVLITSPAHMKFFEAALLENPEIRAIVSATAPLTYAQAERLESRGDLAVMEIYGSTETGSLAIRRTVDGNVWQPVAGFELSETSEGVLATAPHLSEGCFLGDAVDLLPDGQFSLLGRKGDMIGIAGKRSNLSALNAILLETPHLLDGVVLRRQTDADDQLAIVAVVDPAKGLSKEGARSEMRKQFHAHVDAVFFPKRIVLVESLPRTPTGKITAEATAELRQLCGWI
ncbi:MAG: acyl-CoA synthetase [Rhodospirillaceae bacterium]|jgi:acyl-coenzyme A synthetase/AMP-(fatty) acid ligase|nr:acyl-CoA synthetase [Rhodospirillaceae bacterium]